MTYEETKNQGLKLFDEKFIKLQCNCPIADHSSMERFTCPSATRETRFEESKLISFLTTFAEKIRESVVEEIKIKNALVIEEVNNRLKGTCPPHNYVFKPYTGAWGGILPPPTMFCTQCGSTA